MASSTDIVKEMLEDWPYGNDEDAMEEVDMEEEEAEVSRLRNENHSLVEDKETLTREKQLLAAANMQLREERELHLAQIYAYQVQLKEHARQLQEYQSQEVKDAYAAAQSSQQLSARPQSFVGERSAAAISIRQPPSNAAPPPAPQDYGQEDDAMMQPDQRPVPKVVRQGESPYPHAILSYQQEPTSRKTSSRAQQAHTIRAPDMPSRAPLTGSMERSGAERFNTRNGGTGPSSNKSPIMVQWEALRASKGQRYPYDVCKAINQLVERHDKLVSKGKRLHHIDVELLAQNSGLVHKHELIHDIGQKLLGGLHKTGLVKFKEPKRREVALDTDELYNQYCELR